MVQQRFQPTDSDKQASAVFALDLVDQQRLLKLPPIAHWYDANQVTYREVFERLNSVSQKEGVEILRRIHQGQSVSDLFTLDGD
jgi:hypothetical protein